MVGAVTSGLEIFEVLRQRNRWDISFVMKIVKMDFPLLLYWICPPK